jgi:GNAT superfamily N-acetyltransferase
VIDLVDIEPDDPRLVSDVFPVLQELRNHLAADGLRDTYERGHRQGLRFLAAYVDDECAGVAGWRIIENTAHGRKLHVDDLVTHGDRRSSGVGHALIGELERRARAASCAYLDLDSGVQRADAHRFYMREGLTISSFHFLKRLD